MEGTLLQLGGSGESSWKGAMGRGRKIPEKKFPAPQPKPRRDWILIALCGLGLVVAGYLTWVGFTSKQVALCVGAGPGCDAVQTSRYATFLGVPTALWGVALYALLLALGVVGLTTAGRWLVAFLLAVVGVSFTAYLTYLELFVIRAICSYCVVSALVITALMIRLATHRPEIPSRRAALPTPRLVTFAILAAVLTVAGAAAIYAIPTGEEVAANQIALAQHLGRTGAIMYGAYW